jgi:ATP-dependent helicase/nuclease subunit A
MPEMLRHVTDSQAAAADPSASVWVSASAGTGKTRVLTDRVLRLMLLGTPPERILCLTFTRAAAAEMANRLHDDLATWVSCDDDTLAAALAALTGHRPSAEEKLRARRLFAAVLDVPGGLRIQTIHAFCESLLARFPLEAGLMPHFTVIDERSAGEHARASRDTVLARARVDAHLAGFLADLTGRVAEDRFAEVMAALIGERTRLDGILRALDHDLDRVLAVLRGRLGLADGEDEAAIRDAAGAPAEVPEEDLARVAAAMRAGGKTDRARGDAIVRWLAAPAVRGATLDDYGTVFFTKEGGRRAAMVTKATAERCPEADGILAAEASRLERVIERLRAAATYADTAALLAVGHAIVQSYEATKNRLNLLDYDDLIVHARDLLSRPGIAPWVLYKLDGGIDHVLVDEAQDTNADQWRVIEALTDEFFAGHGARETTRTVFAVGDAKQSIYSFQRADPALFSAWRERFGDRVSAARQPWRPVTLAQSFRTVPAVLSLVDTVFEDPEAGDGVVFASADLHHESQRAGQAGIVELWPPETVGDQEDAAAWALPAEQVYQPSPSVRLAQRIAERVAHWLADGEYLPSRDRPVRPGDVMILVQRRAGFADAMVRALKQAGVPVAGSDRMVLIEQLAVMDLLAVARFVLLPEDDLSLAEALKSPLFRFDDDLLFAVAWNRDSRSLWSTLRDRRAIDPVADAAVGRLERLLAIADRVAPYEFFAGVLGEMGGRRDIVARLGAEANDPLDELLALSLQYERGHAPSLQGFLHWLETGGTEVKRDLELGRDEVRILTVHGSKGLQAPIVFLPDTCRVPRSDDPLLWLDGPGDVPSLLLWPSRRDREDATARSARDAARQRRIREYRRLLYVALTRAEDRIYVAGFHGPLGVPVGSWYDLVQRAMVSIGDPAPDAAGREVLRLESEQAAAPDRAGRARQGAPSIATLPDWARRPAPEEPTPPTPLAPSRPRDVEPPLRSPLGPDAGERFRRGRLAHRLLELLPDLPADKRRAAGRAYLSIPAHRLEPDAQDEILRAVLGVLEDPEFAAVFAPGSRAEVPLVGMIGGTVVSGQVDRLCVDRETVTVVDYKTDRPAPDSAAAVAAAYLRQISAYRGLLRDAFPDRAVRCVLLWTDGPRLMALPDDLLDRWSP